MAFADFCNHVNIEESGREMYQLICRLYPICRSITGNGFRETLRIIQQTIPLTIHEVPSGTKVFDWTIPKEWNIRDAYVKRLTGQKIIDFKQCNLHVVSYSTPLHKIVSLTELREHLFTIPEKPDWVPYRTSYYSEKWGFCISHNQLLDLKDDEYEVFIDATLADGHLTYGESHIPGGTENEVLISCDACHPSLCNDNLSGIAMVVSLAKCLGSVARRYSYRFLFLPATIGPITWLCLNESLVSNITHGLVVACVGDRGKITYKKSRRGDAEIDRAATHVLRHSGEAHEILEFSPYGYDERQFCSPGFNLPVGCLMRTPHGRFPEYHTSADNLQFVQPEYLADSLGRTLSVLDVLENNRLYLNQNPKCEPQLGKRGLYRSLGGQQETRLTEMALLWVLNLSDGSHTLLDIAARSGLSFDDLKGAAEQLLKCDLLKEIAA